LASGPVSLTSLVVAGGGVGGGGSTYGLPTSVNSGGSGVVIIKYRI